MFVCCQVGCQSFQAKSLSSSQSEFISYPLERNVHDALPSPPLNGESLYKYLMTIFNRTLLHLCFTPVNISCCLFIAHSKFTADLKLSALPLLLHVFCSNGLWAQWSVWGAHARTALSMGCPFFSLAQPITQSQYKHSFLWSTEPLWKRPFNWSSIKGTRHPTTTTTITTSTLPGLLHPLPQPGGLSLRGPVINRREGQS